MDLLALQSDPAAFREALMIDTDAGPKPFAECVKDNEWQSADFAAMDPAWRRAVGQKVDAPQQRAWLERPRGHSKSSDLAVMSAWALFASRRRLSGIAAAGDLEQARILRDSIGRLCYVNPWLAKLIEVQNYRVINPRTESTLDIISSDAKTAYGLTPSFLILDEVTHWKSRDLWDSLISSAAKRATCCVVCITNAGIKDDWQWQAREGVRTSPTWHFSRLDGPQASWITPDLLQEQERLLPAVAYRRLWLNEWSSGGGDFLTPEQINRAFLADLSPQSDAQDGFEYVGGLDLGVSRDASALVILGIRRVRDGHGFIRLAYTRIWRAANGRKVNLMDVEDAVRDAHARFNLRQLNYDPWEARAMASRLQAEGLGLFKSQLTRLHATGTKVPMVEITQTPANLQKMASCLLEAFNDQRIELYEQPDLRRDLTRFRVEEREYGFRLVSPKDALGHGDMGSAFCLAMLAATERAAKKFVTAGIVSEGDSSLSSWQREQKAFEARQAAAAAEHEALRNYDESRALWCQAAREMGGNGRLGF
jgi:phage terminase large subunit-like protein